MSHAEEQKFTKTTQPMKRSLKNTKASSSNQMGKVSYYVSIDFDEMMARIEAGGHGTLLEMALIHLAVDDLEGSAIEVWRIPQDHEFLRALARSLSNLEKIRETRSKAHSSAE